MCDTKITEVELYKALKAFKANKSPGIDGITAEFYLKFWSRLKSKLVQVFEEAFVKEILLESMRAGVIVLLEKHGKDRMSVANWRPITLLGVDYKILTKLLAERLKRVLPDLVHPDQNGFIPGGNIFFQLILSGTYYFTVIILEYLTEVIINRRNYIFFT